MRLGVLFRSFIGLKIQAMSNDPSRTEQDGLDVRLLIRAARDLKQSLDWELIEQYLDLFDKRELLKELKQES